MEITVRVLSDLVEATDKIINVVGKIGNMFLHAVGVGYKISDFNKIRNANVALSGLLGLSVQQQQRQNIDFIPSLKSYLNNPDKNGWEYILKENAYHQQRVALIISDLESLVQEFVAEDFYESLLSTMAERQKVLDALKTIQRPKKDKELEKFKELIARYEKLADELRHVNSIISVYIKKMKSENVWPS